MRTEPTTEENITATINCIAPWRLTKVKPLKHYKLKVEFVDGTQGFVEMKKRIMSHTAGVFKKLINVDIFNQVHLQHGAVTWPGDIDLAPDAMHDAIKAHGVWSVE